MFGILAAALTMAPSHYRQVNDTEIIIGMVNAQSGPASGLGKGMRTGVQAAFDTINAAGGVNGRKLKLLVEDDGYEPNKTIDATLKLIDEKVFCLTGFVGTPTSMAALDIIKDTKIPSVGFFTGAGGLRNPVLPQVVHIRASYGDETEEIVERFTKDLGAKKIAVFQQNDAFGQAVLGGVQKALDKRGIPLAGKGTFERNSLAVQSGLADIIKADPDLVVMAGPYAPLAEFVKQAKAHGLKCHFATVSFVGTENFIKAAGSDGDGVVISQVVPSPSSDISVVKSAKDAVGKVADGAPFGYVTLEGYVTGLTLAKAIEATGKDLTRENLIKAFDGMSSIDLGGFSLSYSATERQGSKKVFMTVIKGGQAVEVGSLN